MKRFYTDVSVREADGGFQVMLDARALKTVGGAPQIVPTQELAQALAKEWSQQGEKIDPATLPMRDMADYAIDVVTGTRAEVAEKLLAYADTDTLCYRADPEDALFARQQEVWEPILADFEQREGVSLSRISGIMHKPQPEATMETLRARVQAQDAFTLAATEMATSLAASLVCGMTATLSDAEPLTIWQAASLEEEWQADLWGRDEEAEERRERRQEAFMMACEFARLARG